MPLALPFTPHPPTPANCQVVPSCNNQQWVRILPYLPWGWDAKSPLVCNCCSKAPVLSAMLFCLPFNLGQDHPLRNGPPGNLFPVYAHLGLGQCVVSPSFYLGRKCLPPTIWGGLGCVPKAKINKKNNELPCSHYQKSEPELDPCALG